MLRVLVLVTLAYCTSSAPTLHDCIDPCAIHDLHLPRNVNFSRPGNWSERNAYGINGGRGKVHEEYGQYEDGSMRMRYFKKNSTYGSRSGHLEDHSDDRNVDYLTDRTRDQFRVYSTDNSRGSLSRDHLRDHSRDINQSENFGVRGLDQDSSEVAQSRSNNYSRSNSRNFDSSQVSQRNYQRDNNRMINEYEKHEERHHEESSSQKSHYSNNQRIVSQQTVNRVPHYHYNQHYHDLQNQQVNQNEARNTYVGKADDNNFHPGLRAPSGQFRVGVLDMHDGMTECTEDHDVQQPVTIQQVNRHKRNIDKSVDLIDQQSTDQMDDLVEQENEDFTQQMSNFEETQGAQTDQISDSLEFNSNYNFNSGNQKYSKFTEEQQTSGRQPVRNSWYPRYHGGYNNPKTKEHSNVDGEFEFGNQAVSEMAEVTSNYKPSANDKNDETGDMKNSKELPELPSYLDSYRKEEAEKMADKLIEQLNRSLYQYGVSNQNKFKDSTQHLLETNEDFNQETQDSVHQNTDNLYPSSIHQSANLNKLKTENSMYQNKDNLYPSSITQSSNLNKLSTEDSIYQNTDNLYPSSIHESPNLNKLKTEDSVYQNTDNVYPSSFHQLPNLNKNENVLPFNKENDLLQQTYVTGDKIVEQSNTHYHSQQSVESGDMSGKYKPMTNDKNVLQNNYGYVQKYEPEQKSYITKPVIGDKIIQQNSYEVGQRHEEPEQISYVHPQPVHPQPVHPEPAHLQPVYPQPVHPQTNYNQFSSENSHHNFQQTETLGQFSQNSGNTDFTQMNHLYHHLHHHLNHHNHHHHNHHNHHHHHMMENGESSYYIGPPSTFNRAPEQHATVYRYMHNPFLNKNLHAEHLTPVSTASDTGKLHIFNNQHSEDFNQQQEKKEDKFHPTSEKPYQQNPVYQQVQNSYENHRQISSNLETGNLEKPLYYNQGNDAVETLDMQSHQLENVNSRVENLNVPEKPLSYGQNNEEKESVTCMIYPPYSTGTKTSSRRKPRPIPCSQLPTTAKPKIELDNVELLQTTNSNIHPNNDQQTFIENDRLHSFNLNVDSSERYRGDVPVEQTTENVITQPAITSSPDFESFEDNEEKQQIQVNENHYITQPPRQVLEQVSTNDNVNKPKVRYEQPSTKSQSNWPPQIDSHIMRQNYHQFMGDLTNSEMTDHTSQGTISSMDQQTSNQQSITRTHFNNNGESQNPEDMRNPITHNFNPYRNKYVYQQYQEHPENQQANLQQPNDQQVQLNNHYVKPPQPENEQYNQQQVQNHQANENYQQMTQDNIFETNDNYQQVSDKSFGRLSNQETEESQLEVDFQPRILEAYGGNGRYNKNHSHNFREAKVNPSATLAPLTDGVDPWIIDEKYDEKVIPLQPTFEEHEDVAFVTEVTTQPNRPPGFWSRLGHKITNTYDKAKEKARNIFG